MDKKYRYFISGYINYIDEQGKNFSGMFNTEVGMNRKINSITDINKISEKYEKVQNLPSNSVTIISFQLFDK